MPKNIRGPHLNMAVICEKVIEGKDGALSIIRVVDTVTQTATGPEPPPQLPPFILQGLTLVLMFRADEARGRYSIKVRPEAPDGRQLVAIENALHMDGGERGANVLMDIVFPVELEGVYWFDLLFVAAEGDERLLTRVPLKVVYQPQKTPQ